MRGLRSGSPSMRPSIDLLYDIEQIINPSRLTKALARAGSSIAARMAMIAITTSNSIRVKPPLGLEFNFIYLKSSLGQVSCPGLCG